MLTAVHVSGLGRMRAGAGLKELGMVSQPDNVSNFEEVAAPCFAPCADCLQPPASCQAARSTKPVVALLLLCKMLWT